ncbi:extracellular solute-binding protein, partial [Corynebacterium gottingense]
MKLTATRKTGAALCAIALATTGLTACSNSESDSEASGGASGAAAEGNERGPITFAMGRNDTDKLIPIIDKWNAEHPDEQVTLSELAGEADDQRDTLVQSLQAGGDDYDVMALDVVWTADFAANQWLQPLEGDFAVDTSGLLPATVESATYGDKLVALPQNTNGQLLFRNADVIEEAPDTFEDIR